MFVFLLITKVNRLVLDQHYWSQVFSLIWSEWNYWAFSCFQQRLLRKSNHAARRQQKQLVAPRVRDGMRVSLKNWLIALTPLDYPHNVKYKPRGAVNHNHCSDADPRDPKPFCYTSNRYKRWEYCECDPSPLCSIKQNWTRVFRFKFCKKYYFRLSAKKQ